MVTVVSERTMGEPMRVRERLQVLMRPELRKYKKQLAKHQARRKLKLGDSCPPPRCRRRRRLATTKPRIALTGVGAMNA